MSHEQTASFKSERQKVELGPWAHATKERLEWPNQAKGGGAVPHRSGRIEASAILPFLLPSLATPLAGVPSLIEKEYGTNGIHHVPAIIVE